MALVSAEKFGVHQVIQYTANHSLRVMEMEIC